jgi:hypothetical protein
VPTFLFDRSDCLESQGGTIFCSTGRGAWQSQNSESSGKNGIKSIRFN